MHKMTIHRSGEPYQEVELSRVPVAGDMLYLPDPSDPARSDRHYMVRLVVLLVDGSVAAEAHGYDISVSQANGMVAIAHDPTGTGNE